MPILPMQDYRDAERISTFRYSFLMLLCMCPSPVIRDWTEGVSSRKRTAIIIDRRQAADEKRKRITMLLSVTILAAVIVFLIMHGPAGPGGDTGDENTMRSSDDEA